MKFDIGFVGNTSIDNIIKHEEIIKTYGGSALYSSLSCKSVSSSKIAVVSNLNKEINSLLTKYEITVVGNISDDVTTFNINEIDGSCIGTYYNSSKIELLEPVHFGHLHISFRKGVDVESVLHNKNITFDKLSIDVMIHSVREFTELIRSSISKIDILFCNFKEYEILKNTIESIPIKVITNEEKPIIVMDKEKVYCAYINPVDNIKSVIGAGDSFIGGFLGEFIKSSNLAASVMQGIANAGFSIKNYGPILEKNCEKNNQSVITNMPNNIIVIGNSCSGKTSFVECLKASFNIYNDIDDLGPLLEMFKVDDLVAEKQFDRLIHAYNSGEIKFMIQEYKDYFDDLDAIKPYSRKSLDGKGHDILRPILWDLILKQAVLVLSEKNNIIQFSRGYDINYEKEFGKEVYKRSLEIVLSNVKNSDSTLIVNLTTPLDIRKKRNHDRFLQGGHFVSEETMDFVYANDTFDFIKINDTFGYINIGGKEYPVYSINNDNSLTSLELEFFLMYNMKESIEYFSECMEAKKDEFKTNTKRRLAKQIK